MNPYSILSRGRSAVGAPWFEGRESPGPTKSQFSPKRNDPGLKIEILQDQRLCARRQYLLGIIVGGLQEGELASSTTKREQLLQACSASIVPAFRP